MDQGVPRPPGRTRQGQDWRVALVLPPGRPHRVAATRDSSGVSARTVAAGLPGTRAVWHNEGAPKSGVTTGHARRAIAMSVVTAPTICIEIHATSCGGTFGGKAAAVRAVPRAVFGVSRDGCAARRPA